MQQRRPCSLMRLYHVCTTAAFSRPSFRTGPCVSHREKIPVERGVADAEPQFWTRLQLSEKLGDKPAQVYPRIERNNIAKPLLLL